MTDWTTIRIRQDAKDKAQTHKRDSETWSEYLLRCSDNPPEVNELVEKTDGVETMKDSIQTIEQRTNSIERMLEDVTNEY